MTKAELVEALDMYFDDDEVVVCADENGAWDNIELTGTNDGRQYLFIQTHQLGEAIIGELVLKEDHERREHERMEDEAFGRKMCLHMTNAATCPRCKEARSEAETCNYPKCNCPFDKTDTCLRGLPERGMEDEEGEREWLEIPQFLRRDGRNEQRNERAARTGGKSDGV